MKSALIIAVLVAGVLHSAAPGGEKIHVRGVSLQRGYPGVEVFAHSGGRSGEVSKVAVKSFLNAEGDPVAVSTGSLVFTRKRDRSSVSEAAEVLGRVEVPGGLKSGVLLFRAGAEGEEGAVFLIDDSSRSFPVGSFKLVNLSSESLRIELEGKPYDCEPGAATLIVDPPVRANSTSGMKAYRKDGDKWVMFSSTIWTHPGKRRVLQVAVEDPRSKRIQLKGVRDVVK